MPENFALFETAVGRCAIVWSDGGIGAVYLPEATDAMTRSRVLRRHPASLESVPPNETAVVIERIVALLRGESVDLGDVALDLSDVAEFDRRVYEIARTIPAGRTLSYGEIARRLGDPTLARAVGQSLGRNPWPIIVPCHRVLAADGRLGGFSAPGGAETKRKMLRIEGALLTLDL